MKCPGKWLPVVKELLTKAFIFNGRFACASLRFALKLVRSHIHVLLDCAMLVSMEDEVPRTKVRFFELIHGIGHDNQTFPGKIKTRSRSPLEASDLKKAGDVIAK